MLRKLGVAVCAAAGLLLAMPGAAPAVSSSSAAATRTIEQYWNTTYKNVQPASDELPSALLAKASADECYGGIGAPFDASADCPAGRRPKVNQAYVWGLTKAESNLWFGTAPNVLCLVLSGYLGSTTPVENDAWACEFGSSGFRKTMPALPAALGDWRPSSLFRYDLATKRLVDVGLGVAGADRARLNTTLGIRSAGSLGRTVLFAGPSMSTAGGLNVFAFDAVTGEFIASKTLAKYNNIRRWIVVGGKLYTAVGKTGGGGALLRFDGDADHPGTLAQPSGSLFDLAEVGTLPSEGADLAEHEGRIYVTTWPQAGTPAGLYMSPVVPSGGLPASGDALQRVWSAADYEPDPVTAATYGGGALGSIDGKLVWGTMHVPFTATFANLARYADDYGDDPDTDDVLAAVAGTFRAAAIFSGEKLGTPDQTVQVLYGNEKLPTYVEGDGWVMKANKMGQKPLLGQAGFDNPFNNYTWAIGRAASGLYVGTMDWSYLFAKALPMVVERITGKTVPANALTLPVGRWGADLVRFRAADRPVVVESSGGVGNYANYGVRTMVAEPERLYVGTANPMNLLTDADGALLGGWELRRLGPEEQFPPAPQPPSAPATEPGAPGVSGQGQRGCVSGRHFRLHLGMRLKVATRKGMRNIRRIAVTVNGHRVKAARTSGGISIPVDLRGTTKAKAVVRVELRLRKAITVQRSKGGHAKTTRIVRSYAFTACR